MTLKSKTRMNRWIYIIVGGLILLSVTGVWSYNSLYKGLNRRVGDVVDSLNGVKVYYNGKISHVEGRNLTKDNYNLGLKYQCVEFVKRYYYERFGHRMPDSYGHAKDYFDTSVKDGEKNLKRNLKQYTNLSKHQPRVEDILILDGTIFNPYGHVAIISAVSDEEVEVIQQNPGPRGKSRDIYKVSKEENKWKFENGRVLGWLSRE